MIPSRKKEFKKQKKKIYAFFDKEEPLPPVLQHLKENNALMINYFPFLFKEAGQYRIPTPKYKDELIINSHGQNRNNYELAYDNDISDEKFYHLLMKNSENTDSASNLEENTSDTQDSELSNEDLYTKSTSSAQDDVEEEDSEFEDYSDYTEEEDLTEAEANEILDEPSHVNDPDPPQKNFYLKHLEGVPVAKAISDQMNVILAFNTKQEQIDFIFDLVCVQMEFTQLECAKIFGKNRKKGFIAAHKHRRKYGRKKNGRPALLSPNELIEMCEFMIKSYEDQDPCSIEDAYSYVLNSFHKDININSLRKMITATKKLKAVKGIPMDKFRVECPPEKIDEHFALLEKLLKIIPLE